MSRMENDAIRDLAARQHGVLTRQQLLSRGVSASAIGRHVNAGRLRLVHRGVYRAGPIEPPRAPEMAAVLAGGPTAVLSHTHALRVLRMFEVDVTRPIHVTVPGRARSRRPGIRFHRVARLDPDERTVVDGIPVTSPARTLLDVAGLLGRREVEAAAAAAERAGLVTREELATLPERYVGRRGARVLRAVFGDGRELDFVRSEAERRCLATLRAAGLPRPRTNVRIGPYELDLYWPRERVAVEIDGRAFHSGDPRFEGDRRKDRWLLTRGIRVVRVTWRQIVQEAMPMALQVGQILAVAAWDRNRAAPVVFQPAFRDESRPRDAGAP